MSDMRDDIASVLLSAEDIQKRTAELGARISKDFDGREPLFVGVLKGCFVFMADLMRSVTIPCSVDFMAVSSYGNQTTTTGAVKINKDLDKSVKGESILLVEDIVDTGRTLKEVKKQDAKDLLVQTHKSFLVNLMWITSYQSSPHLVFVKGREGGVPISKYRYDEFVETYMEYYRRKLTRLSEKDVR